MIIPKELVLLATLFLQGCGTVTQYGGAAVDRATADYDASLAAAELWVCRGASVGAVIRAYGQSDEQWQSWLSLCGYAGSPLTRPLPNQ